MSRKVILYIAMSIDGYIAKPNDDLSFLSIVEKEGEDYGYATFIKTVDTVILGRKTYDWIMAHVPEFVHADKETFVITRTTKSSIDNTHFYTDNLKELIHKLKAAQGKNIFIDGGSEIVNALLKEQLIDEMVLSIIPVVLGSGVRLFNDNNPEQQFSLVSSQAFDKGLVQLHYSFI
ncbi:dihydrofolate reductase family protein [Cytophaga aurantiaca]|uniref:dihydrofolate reductase family protein n=1 Tax=Cytophaga aurantiaca TaxID=29530 RepID=UPI0003A68B6F|nr:dihydrofolate reductase family protein [Cytophaga aurantiaca]